MSRARRHQGEGSIYQTKSGLWRGVADLGYVGGKRRRRYVSARTQKEVSAKLRAARADVLAGIRHTGSVTVGDWLTYWVDDLTRARERTQVGYRTYLRTWLIPHLGDHRLDKLTPDHIRAMLREMERAGRSRATRQQAYSILRAALRQAVADRRIAWSPVDSVRAPGVDRGSHHGRLSLPDALAVIAALDGDPLASRWLAALLLGLRQGEALGLRWEDVDLDAGTLRVERAVQRMPGKGLVVVPLKSASSRRIVPLLPPVVWALQRLPHRDGYVWGRDAGSEDLGGDRPMPPRTDWGRWGELLKRAGVDRVPLHAARATTASLLMEAGVADVVTSEILGHAQVTITRSAYLTGDDRVRRDAMTALGNLVYPTGGPPSLPRKDTHS